MDELLLLRRVRDHVPEPGSQVLAEGRAKLLAQINEVSGTSVKRPRYKARARWAGAGIGVVTASALMVALVAANVVGLAGWRGGADPAAAEVLHNAALSAINNSDPVLGPGQYILVDTAAVYGATVQVDDSDQMVSYLTITNDQLYVPADRNGDWVWVRGLAKPYQTFGPESQKVADDSWAAVVAEHGADYQELLRAPKGAFYSYENIHSPDKLDALPRDPYLLLNHIYKVTLGQGSSPDGEALVWIADTLRFGAVPADLRAALYKAAAMIPGVEITEEQANLNGATGIAIGRVEEANGIRQDIIIDPATGQLIGERQVLTRGDQQSGYPAGTTIAWTAITTTVANSAPEGGTPNGAMDEQGCEQTAPGAFQCPVQEGPDE
ncbi:MAG: CU044_5270 family protein [Actinomycetota bacterium]|nr:CU044_5270 family protein [Actinomycetota bacterium]